ncbi:hypothetical protein C8J57DRAFT_1659850 [Mycena rebaudengoi]|nr:hypothetical protein C8J57DRAFT_1659850 [Mycena rebaudengoi]
MPSWLLCNLLDGFGQRLEDLNNVFDASRLFAGLFGGLPAFSTFVKGADGVLWTIAPASPALVIASPALTTSGTASTGVTAGANVSGKDRHPASTATGARKNLIPTGTALILLEALTQKRNYVVPSRTSRKVVPAVFRARLGVESTNAKESKVEDEDEELGELSPTATLAETIEYQRRGSWTEGVRTRRLQFLSLSVVVSATSLRSPSPPLLPFSPPPSHPAPHFPRLRHHQLFSALALLTPPYLRRSFLFDHHPRRASSFLHLFSFLLHGYTSFAIPASVPSVLPP